MSKASIAHQPERLRGRRRLDAARGVRRSVRSGQLDAQRGRPRRARRVRAQRGDNDERSAATRAAMRRASTRHATLVAELPSGAAESPARDGAPFESRRAACCGRGWDHGGFRGRRLAWRYRRARGGRVDSGRTRRSRGGSARQQPRGRRPRCRARKTSPMGRPSRTSASCNDLRSVGRVDDLRAVRMLGRAGASSPRELRMPCSKAATAYERAGRHKVLRAIARVEDRGDAGGEVSAVLSAGVDQQMTDAAPIRLRMSCRLGGSTAARARCSARCTEAAPVQREVRLQLLRHSDRIERSATPSAPEKSVRRPSPLPSLASPSPNQSTCGRVVERATKVVERATTSRWRLVTQHAGSLQAAHLGRRVERRKRGATEHDERPLAASAARRARGCGERPPRRARKASCQMQSSRRRTRSAASVAASVVASVAASVAVGARDDDDATRQVARLAQSGFESMTTLHHDGLIDGIPTVRPCLWMR